MNLYVYWDNSEQWHGKKVLATCAETLTEADEEYEETTGHNPIKQPHIGCQITKLVGVMSGEIDS